MNRHLSLLSALALLLPPPSLHAAGESASAPIASATRSSDTGHADGMIVGIDADRGRITLKHGAIEGLGMPAMTMVFRVADPLMLMQLKAGDGVSFTVTRSNNFFTVTQLARR
jgi:Cu(I)/Ag(I) efflux system periplasmic protein CusF